MELPPTVPKSSAGAAVAEATKQRLPLPTPRLPTVHGHQIKNYLIEGQNVDNFLTFIESSFWALIISFLWREIDIVSLPDEKIE